MPAGLIRHVSQVPNTRLSHTAVCRVAARNSRFSLPFPQWGTMLASCIAADSGRTTPESFLSDSPHAIALENGEPLFDSATARYAVSGEGKCVLYPWSDERNALRRVLDAGVQAARRHLSVLRFGQSQPTIREISADPTGAAPPHRALATSATSESSSASCCASFQAITPNRSAIAPISSTPAAPSAAADFIARTSPCSPSWAPVPKKLSPPSTLPSPAACSGSTASASTSPAANSPMPRRCSASSPPAFAPIPLPTLFSATSLRKFNGPTFGSTSARGMPSASSTVSTRETIELRMCSCADPSVSWRFDPSTTSD